MKYETIVAVYDTAAHADAAKRALMASGVAPSQISTIGKDRLAPGGVPIQDIGVWQRLFGDDIREHEAHVYGRTVANGGAVLSARVPSTEVAHAVGVLTVHKPVDVHERASDLGVVPSAEKAAAAMPKPALAPKQTVAPALKNSEDEVLRLAEEHMEVGKRQIQTGKARVRRYVTTEEVEAPITLHQQHMEVIRRVVADPKSVDGIDWEDRAIEIIETDEEPVVSKTARVAEEVIVHKAGSDHVEKVHGTIRRQQVQVERFTDQPGKH
jgi:uncharacterized protein (TIGR02271 family)